MSDEAADLLNYLSLESRRVQVLEVDTLPIVLGKHANVLQLTPHVEQIIVKRLHKARANLTEKTRSSSLSFSFILLSRSLARMHAHAVSVSLSVSLSVCLFICLSLSFSSFLIRLHSTLSLCLSVSLCLPSSSITHSPLLSLL